jgi:lysophospholipase L1-like esterase
MVQPASKRLLTEAAAAAQATDNATPLGAALSATYAPNWKPNTAYTSGQKVTTPDGDVVTAISSFTSGATFTPAKWEYSKTYTKRDEGTTSLLATMPNLVTALRTYNDATAPPIRIIGLGSSVGVGADTPDPTNQAPVAYFKTQLNAAVNKHGRRNITVTNGSVNGSIITDGNSTAYANAKTAAGGTPTAVLLAYGMNDGGPGQYHTGQTYPGAYLAMMQLIASIKLDGGDPIVMTTPHPHSNKYPWAGLTTTGWSYPKDASNNLVAIPGTDRASSVTEADWAGMGVNIPAHYRYLRINESMRQAAADSGVPLIDVERYWFKAVAKYGEDALFNGAEYVHPNLLGHQQSYWRAIDDFVAGLTKPLIATAAPEKNTTYRLTKINNSTRSSTTRTADSELSFNVGPNQYWEVEVDLFYTTPTDADLRVEFGVPAGTLGSIGVIGPAQTATTFDNQEGVHRRSTVENGWLGVGGIGADGYAKVKGIIKTQANGGTVSLKYGQAVASGTATIYNDSYMRATRVK